MIIKISFAGSYCLMSIMFPLCHLWCLPNIWQLCRIQHWHGPWPVFRVYQTLTCTVTSTTVCPALNWTEASYHSRQSIGLDWGQLPEYAKHWPGLRPATSVCKALAWTEASYQSMQCIGLDWGQLPEYAKYWPGLRPVTRVCNVLAWTEASYKVCSW